MKLYITYGSPYARLARIVVIEKKLGDRVEVIPAKTRAAGSPYYEINPSGRVPYLVDDDGAGMEDSQLICAYLDGLDGKRWLRHAIDDPEWTYRRLEASARSLCEGICVWVRQMALPAAERSPIHLAHETARAQRMADMFESRVSDPLLQGAPNMAQLLLGVSLELAPYRHLGDLTEGRPRLAAWMRRISALPAMRATPPQ